MKIKWPPSLTSTLLTKIIIIIRIIIPLIGREKTPVIVPPVCFKYIQYRKCICCSYNILLGTYKTLLSQEGLTQIRAIPYLPDF